MDSSAMEEVTEGEEGNIDFILTGGTSSTCRGVCRGLCVSMLLL